MGKNTTLKHRAAASSLWKKAGVTNLFLIVNAATSLVHLVRASTSIPSSSSELCSDETAACFDSLLCWDCVVQFAEDSGAGSCRSHPTALVDSSDCDVMSDLFCCSFHVSGQDCLGDAVTMDFFRCSLEESGCTLSESVCSAGVGIPTPSAPLSTTPAPVSAASDSLMTIPGSPAPTAAPCTLAQTTAPFTPVQTTIPSTPAPTNAPLTPAPTTAPTAAPTTAPTAAPTTAPTAAPSFSPTSAPTFSPTTTAPSTTITASPLATTAPIANTTSQSGSDEARGLGLTPSPSTDAVGRDTSEPSGGSADAVTAANGAGARMPRRRGSGLHGYCVGLVAVVGAWVTAAVMLM